MGSPQNKMRIIDADVHHTLRSTSQLFPYLPRHYCEQIKEYGLQFTGRAARLNGGKRGMRSDLKPEGGGHPGSDIELMKRELLDRYNVEYAILTGEFYGVSGLLDIEYVTALASAYNDWTIEHWLEKDSRLKGSIYITPQAPEEAAAEIRRAGKHPDMVQAFVTGGARMPYGQRFYHPIYEACVELDIPFCIHIGMEGVGINAPPTGAGYPTYYVEYRSVRPQVYMAHLTSFIFEGVFEIFPTLKVFLIEAGVFWYPPFLWRLDEDWKALRGQTPWVKMPPSEYFKRNVRVGSQPIEPTPTRKAFMDMLGWMNAEETLVFCSDFPHYDFDSPVNALPPLPNDLKKRVFYENARELYNLPATSEEKTATMTREEAKDV